MAKLTLLGLNPSLCNWILDFLSERLQTVQIGNNFSSTLSTGAPQGYVLSPLLFTLLTHDCAAMHISNHISEFADETHHGSVICEDDELACFGGDASATGLVQSQQPVSWRGQNERDGCWLKRAGNIHSLLGVHLAENLTWSLNTSSIVKKAQQCLYFLRRLKKAHLPPPSSPHFTVESILSSCITVWFGNCTILDHKTLQQTVRTAETFTDITDIYTTRYIPKAISIANDPPHQLFTLLFKSMWLAWQLRSHTLT